jgi:hypothetical protein
MDNFYSSRELRGGDAAEKWMGNWGRWSSLKEGEDGGCGFDSGNVSTSPTVGVGKREMRAKREVVESLLGGFSHGEVRA